MGKKNVTATSVLVFLPFNNFGIAFFSGVYQDPFLAATDIRYQVRKLVSLNFFFPNFSS